MSRYIETITSIRAPFARVRDVLVDDPGSMFTAAAATTGERRHFVVELSVESRRGLTVAQEVEVELGRVTVTPDEVALELRWDPIGHHRMLPSFDGQVLASRGVTATTSLTLRGSYRVPLGAVGRVGDRVVGQRIARESLGDLVAEMGRRIDAEVDRRHGSIRFRPAPYPADLRER